MYFLLCLRPLKSSSYLVDISTRSLYLSSRLLIDQKWRQSRGLPENPNAYGPLTDGPDFTYIDGRPTPVGSRLKKRLVQQREIAKKVIEFTKEIDFAVEFNEKRKQQEENKKKMILESKLKPKGMPLLMSSKDKK